MPVLSVYRLHDTTTIQLAQLNRIKVLTSTDSPGSWICSNKLFFFHGQSISSCKA